MAKSDKVRVKVRNARVSGGGAPIEIVTVHAFCPCDMGRGANAEYTTLDDAVTALAADDTSYSLCKRSVLPEEPADDDQPTETDPEADEPGEEIEVREEITAPTDVQTDAEPQTDEQPGGIDVTEDAQLVEAVLRAGEAFRAETEPHTQQIVRADTGEVIGEIGAGYHVGSDPEPPSQFDAPAEEIEIADGDEQPTETPDWRAVLTAALGDAREPGAPDDAVSSAFGRAVAAIIDGYRHATADERTDAATEVTVTNSDNAGAARRDAITALVTELGGATDSHGVKNETNSGIYWFRIEIFAPRFVADALDELLPVLADRQQILLTRAGQAEREHLRAANLRGKEFNRAASAFLRTWITAFGAAITAHACAASDAADLTPDVTPFETAAKANRNERRLTDREAKTPQS
jgi:hypothetical protein